MRRPLVTVVVLALPILGYLAATPYITARQIKIAARAGDGSALSEHIDFEALRQNLKDQLNIYFAMQMTKDGENVSHLAAIGGLFMGVMIDKLVDSYAIRIRVAGLKVQTVTTHGLTQRWDMRTSASL
jgi:hypothetical protein